MSKNDDVCLNMNLITPLTSEIERLSTDTKKQILSNNEFYCRFCPEYNDICEEVE